MPLPVSICIPVRNEEVNLPRCLAALADFSEIVVVDSGSTDRTSEIARAAGATVLDFKWDGQFPKKRNWTLRNHHFTNPWVLFLDADECVTPAFLAELKSKLADTTNVGFWISFTNWFMGKPLRHGDVFRKLALFKIGAGEYEKFPENWWSHLDMEVHEHPVLTGQVGEISAPLEHHDYRGLKHYLTKHNEYSSWEANRFLWLREAPQEAWNALNSRQQFKYRHLHRWWLGWVYFVLSYFIKKGFLDGKAGYIFACMKRRYFSEVRLKIQEASAPSA
jgi:glycosyltransferase involved in cell wall biosynthesis